MRIFMLSMLIAIKRLCRQTGFWAITLLTPLLCALISLYLASGEKTLAIRAGIAVSPGDAFGEAVFNGLARFEGPVAFELYAPGETAVLEEQVMSGKMECAYIISPELSARLKDGKAPGGITALRSPQSVFHVLADEMLFASVLWQNAPEIDRELLAGVLGLSMERAAAVVEERFAYYSKNDAGFLTPVYHYYGGGSHDGLFAARTGSRLLHGLLALFLLAGNMWSLPLFIEEKPVLLPRMSRAAARRYTFGAGGALFLIGMLQGALSLAVIWAFYPSAVKSPAAGLGWLAAYQIAVSMSGLIVLLLLRRGGVLYSAGIFFLLLTAVFGGAAINPRELGTAFSWVSRFFITSGYIDGALGGGTESLKPLAAAALAGVVLVPLLAGRRTGQSRQRFARY